MAGWRVVGKNNSTLGRRSGKGTPDAAAPQKDAHEIMFCDQGFPFLLWDIMAGMASPQTDKHIESVPYTKSVVGDIGDEKRPAACKLWSENIKAAD